MSMNVGQLIACLHEFNPSTPVAGYLSESEDGGMATGTITVEKSEDYDDGNGGLYYKSDGPFAYIDPAVTELVTIHFNG